MADPVASGPGLNIPDYTVSEISGAVKRTVEDSFGYVRVRGEISRPSFPGSGHVYLRLKDDSAVLDAVVWRGTVRKLATRPEEGLEVVCTGRLTTYPGKSSYQLVIEAMEPAGEGALLKMLEERRKRLAAEGLFDAGHKQPLPFLPAVIGVVTSPTGAVIRDILHRLADRFPRPVLVWPVRVQGDGAAEEVSAAIAGFNRCTPDGPVPRPDVLIVARGGGSLEDLLAFNEEVVVRAVAASAIPVIAAIGHETDTTLIDFVADRRAPTPTAAAEMAVPVRADLAAQLMDDGRRLAAAAGRLVGDRRMRLDGLARGLGDPNRLLEERGQRLDGWAERLDMAAQTGLAKRQQRLAGLRLPTPRQQVTAAARSLAGLADRLSPALRRLLADRRRTLARTPLSPRPVRALLQAQRAALVRAGDLLDSVSYHRVLERGYVAVTDVTGRPVTRAAAVTGGMALRLRFMDDVIAAVADGGAAGTGGGPAGSRAGNIAPGRDAAAGPPDDPRLAGDPGLADDPGPTEDPGPAVPKPRAGRRRSAVSGQAAKQQGELF